MKLKYFLLIISLSLIFKNAGAQDKKNVTGKVTDEKGEILIGVNILLKGTNTGTVTDALGRYSLQLSDPNSILVVSYIGFKTIEVPVNNSTSVNITLQADVKSLFEVVITGYQTQRKKDLTGSVSVVNVDNMNKQSTANPIKALQGQVPGVLITGDGNPSGTASIQIRGVGTLNSTQPLYVIDGVPTTAGMHELNANDIESMQVLKDASAASIYGSRAANGVIIITTKQGRAGKLRVNFDSYVSLSDYAYRMKVLNAGGFGLAMWQAAVNSGVNPNKNSLDYQFDWKLDGTGNPILNKIILPEYLDAARTEKTSNTDWFSEITHTGVIQSNSLTVSNGNDKGTYLFSAGSFDNEGIVKTTNFKRYSMRLNSDYKLLNNRVTIGENFTLNKTREVQLPDADLLDLALKNLPIVPVHTADGKGWGGPIGGMNDRQNPVRLLEDNKDNFYNYIRILGNVYADVKIIDGLTFHSNYGVDYGNYNASNFRKKYQSGYLVNDVNKLTVTQSQTTRQTFSNTFNYVKDLGKHHLDAVAGVEYYHQYDHDFWASIENFASEDIDYTYLSAGTGTKDNGGGAAEYALFSYFGKVNYAYDDRYLASFTLRRDGSSRFGPNKRYGVFPAFSLGWRISHEEFFSKLISPEIVSDMKFRYGWGQTGNQEIANNTTYSLYTADYSGGNPTWVSPTGTAYDISGNGSGTLPSGYRQTQTGNPNLKWETSTMSNWGVDFGLFNNKITGSVDYFKKTTSDILVNPAWLAVLGEGGSTWVNGASMENKGLEVALSYNGKIKSDWTYTLSGNWSYYRNKVTELPASVLYNYGGNGTTDNILGHPLGSFYGYVADGLFRTEREVEESATQIGKGLGRIRYSDLNNDGVIDDKDRTWIGSPQPDFTYGFNFSMQYKNFDISFFLQGVQGIDVYNEQKLSTDFWSANEPGSNKGIRLLNAWSPSNPTSTIPALSYTDENNESRFSSYFIESGSYLKLRNLQIGYRLPESVLKRWKMSGVRFYIGGDNLLLILKSKSFTGVDPESPAYGYPNPRVFTAGIKITL